MNLGGGFIPAAFQSSIAWCRNCQVEKNTPPNTESRTIPERRPLHNVLHPSKDIMSDGLLTLETDGGLPDPVIVHGYSSNALVRFVFLAFRVEMRPIYWSNALLSG